ncbi:hypothetical protein [Streptomyces sp. NBC_00038]|nr:hypothetical protein [Streptomyces sp. NBC_00038]MCX5562806.1 hypothetical protein [Streptomyces sp. NBC_00038]
MRLLRGTRMPGRLTVWNRDRPLPDHTLCDLNPSCTFVGGLLVTPTGTR